MRGVTEMLEALALLPVALKLDSLQPTEEGPLVTHRDLQCRYDRY